MARKEAAQPHAARGLNDVFGIVLGCTALLLMVALLSYDPGDSGDRVPANYPPHNLGGPIGAAVAFGLFRVFGAAAFMVPVLLLVFGLGYLFQFLS